MRDKTRQDKTIRCFAWICLLMTANCMAATHYVVTNNPTPADPYTNWGTAGTNIIDVVNAAMTNTTPRTVWVSNGVYVLTNRINITNEVVLQSTNGPDVTVINGNFVAGAPVTNLACLFLSNSAAFVSGFTVSNGARGVYMYSGILSNCTVCNNNGGSGAGVFLYGGGTISACRVTGNIVSGNLWGGGIYCWKGNIFNCVISNNTISGSGGDGGGGGVYAYASTIRSSLIYKNSFLNSVGGGIYVYNSIIADSTVTVNQAKEGGGCFFRSGNITNCLISYNSASSLGGGISPDSINGGACNVDNTIIASNSIYGVRTVHPGSMLLRNCTIVGNNGGVQCYNTTMRNCLITGNTNNGGIWIPSSCQTALVSCCTIAGNVRTNSGAGIRIEATSANILSISSCIIYSNGVSGIDDVFDAASPANINALQYSCVGTNPGFTGAGIISNANPLFVNFAGGHYQLDANSPCINKGSNEPAWMTNSVDLDGGPRIRYGTVDMGAYEHINSGSIFGFH